MNNLCSLHQFIFSKIRFSEQLRVLGAQRGQGLAGGHTARKRQHWDAEWVLGWLMATSWVPCAAPARQPRPLESLPPHLLCCNPGKKHILPLLPLLNLFPPVGMLSLGSLVSKSFLPPRV